MDADNIRIMLDRLPPGNAIGQGLTLKTSEGLLAEASDRVLLLLHHEIRVLSSLVDRLVPLLLPCLNPSY